MLLALLVRAAGGRRRGGRRGRGRRKLGVVFAVRRRRVRLVARVTAVCCCGAIAGVGCRWCGRTGDQIGDGDLLGVAEVAAVASAARRWLNSSSSSSSSSGSGIGCGDVGDFAALGRLLTHHSLPSRLQQPLLLLLLLLLVVCFVVGAFVLMFD